jgi:MFS family permease
MSPPPLRRNARYQFLWAGAACATLGTEINRVALPLTLLALTGSATRAGLVAATLTAAMLLAQMPAGIWDRHDRRRILLLAQAVQVLNALVLLAGLAAGFAGLALFLVFAAVDGVCQAFLGPVRQVSIRAVVPIPQLRGAFAQEEARSHAGRVLGPALGGVLQGVGLLAPYLAMAVSVAAAWCFALAARVPRRPGEGVEAADPGRSVGPYADARSATEAADPDVPIGPDGDDAPREDAADPPADAPRRRGMLAESWEALRWLVGRPGLRELSVVIMAMNFFGGGVTLALIVHIGALGGSGALAGLVLTGIGIGGLIGALASGWVTARVPAGRLAIGVPALLGLCLGLAALPLAPWWPFFPILAFSLVTPALNVASGAVTAQLVPADMLGRVGALLTVTGGALAPLGPLLGGVLAGSLGGDWALAIAGAGFVLTALLGALSPTLRRFEAGE